MVEVATLLVIVVLSVIAFLADFLSGYWALRRKKEILSTRYIIAFASGVIIAAAFFELLPEANIAVNAYLVALGFFSFYAVEKVVMLHSCGEEECEEHEASWISVFGMAADNLADGVGLAVSYLVSPYLGLIVTFAIVAHEVPQGITSVAILKRANFSRRNIMLVLTLAGGLYIIGAVLSSFIPADLHEAMIAFGVGVFLYVGAGDLMAEAHRRFNIKVVASVLVGAALVVMLGFLGG
jgi:zinc and cadmium transporter